MLHKQRDGWVGHWLRPMIAPSLAAAHSPQLQNAHAPLLQLFKTHIKKQSYIITQLSKIQAKFRLSGRY